MISLTFNALAQQRRYRTAMVLGGLIVVLFAGSLAWGGKAAGQSDQSRKDSAMRLIAERDDDLDDWFEFLGNLNNSGLLEPAGSHGSIGLAIAAGGSAHTLPKPHGGSAAESPTTELLNHETDRETPYYLPRLWLMKGLPWPVDLGLSAAAPKNRSFSQAAAFVQWTAYEAFALPALSVRAGHARLFGLPGTEIQSSTFDVVASYGFLRYFTAFVAGGTTRHQAALTVEGENDGAFLLQADETELARSKTWWVPSRAAGLRVTILPPFVALTGEVRQAGDELRSYAVKLGFGM